LLAVDQLRSCPDLAIVEGAYDVLSLRPET